MGGISAVPARMTEGTGARIVVGVADARTSCDPAAELITFALGSCIGVTLFDPVARVGGMLHFMLPMSSLNPEKAAANPAMFGDTGIPALFHAVYALGARKERLVVCAAGGAELLSDDGQFRIGHRNRTLVRRIFWKNGVLLAAEETGGTISRTLVLSMAGGRVTIRNRSEERVLWSA
ncbi:MAG: chemotaxis protein CheD [Phycisphaeraceae bacterium]|nr:chemotaxis protein CheD [Phycisphaeraceae bacterium]